MNPKQALSQLRDIHLPKAISIWPLAPGWYLLIALAFALSFWGTWVYRNRKIRKQFNLEVTKEFSRLKSLATNASNVAPVISELSVLMKRICLTYFPRRQCAGLFGQDLLQFFDDVAHTHFATNSSGQLLIHAAYQKYNSDNTAELFSQCEQWIVLITKQLPTEKRREVKHV